MYVLINSECGSVPERAKLVSSEGNAILNFLVVLGYDPTDPPYADLLRQYHHLEGSWLIVSPVHWEATHNDVMITAQNKSLQLNEAEAKSLFHALADYLKDEGKNLYYHSADTWLLADENTHSLKAKPVHHVVHHSLMREFDQLDKTMYWQKFMTEAQMVFASKSNPSNINGLWVWGGASLKDKKKLKICADEYYLHMARLCSDEVTLYRPTITLNEYQILLLTEWSSLSERHQHELHKKQTHWYWNDFAYTIHPQNVLMRLFGQKA